MKFLDYCRHLVNRLNILELTQFIHLNLNKLSSMLKLLQTIIDNVLLSVGYQHTFKLNSDEVLLHDLIKDITAPKEVPSAFQVSIEEGASTLCFAEQSAGGGSGLSAVLHSLAGSELGTDRFEQAQSELVNANN